MATTNINIVKHEQLCKRYKKLYNDNKEISNFYIKCIKVMNQIFEDIQKVSAREFVKSKEYLTGPPAMSDFYEMRILHNFVAHNVLLKNGITFASYNHLRNIYEALIKIYLNLTNPDLAELNFLVYTQINL